MISIFHSGLSKDLFLILNDADDFNVIIKVGENKNTKEFHAHSVILRARSAYFKKYIYTGELDLTKQSGEDILGLLVASDELLLEELFECIQDYLIEKQTSWIQNHLSLQKPSIHWEKNIHYDLLKRNDFPVEEVIIWDSLIKWGIEQTPGLGSENSDKTKWNDENYEALRKTLDQFIPLIRFLEISSDDFFDRVRPYKVIIPHHIYDEVDEFYYKKTLPKSIILSPRTEKSVSLVSTIIKPRLATVISNWINKNDPATINNKYKFNLIYLLSRDGFDHVTFINKCNGKGPFVVLIRVQSKKIFGGYNPIGYTGRNSCYWLSSTESFVFSFENNQDINNMTISRAANTVCSILNFSRNDNCFFSFGGILYINRRDLEVGFNILHYDDIFDRCSIPIEEIEVFSIINDF
ncbi:hypothetical protein C1645_840109 [Glomus cerebriforme]|uniref:TLD-domain-containing protein n=1 Tax=Glomus cerebriforme TaxID=658196 RepID=A0A397S4N7_9GLOM|nr:hypothetical protein C1645_840109 [Glomus cerebriforme]